MSTPIKVAAHTQTIWVPLSEIWVSEIFRSDLIGAHWILVDLSGTHFIRLHHIGSPSDSVESRWISLDPTEFLWTARYPPQIEWVSNSQCRSADCKRRSSRRIVKNRHLHPVAYHHQSKKHPPASCFSFYASALAVYFSLLIRCALVRPALRTVLLESTSSTLDALWAHLSGCIPRIDSRASARPLSCSELVAPS